MRLAPKLLSAGLIALSSSLSDAYQTEQLRGAPVVVENNSGDGRCRDGEEYMLITSKCGLTGFDRYTMTWRQLSDSCRRPVFSGFEATSHFRASDEGDEDRSELSMYACAPYGYYELEIRVDGPDNLQGIQCHIEAGSNQGRYFTFDKFNKDTQSSLEGRDNMLRTPSSAGTYTWPFQHGDGSQLEKMWSGPEPRACGVAAQTSGDRLDRSLVAGPVPQTTVGTATLKGCYKFSTNAGSSDDTRPLAFAVSRGGMMTNQLCYGICESVGYWLFATYRGNACYCGDGDLAGSSLPSQCTTECENDPHHICGGHTYMSVYDIAVSADTPRQPQVIERPLKKPAQLRGCYELAPNVEEPDGDEWGPILTVTPTLAGKRALTNEDCLDACANGDNWLAGTANGDECYCGEGVPTDEARLTKCTTICTGSPDTIPFEACGGPGTVAIYDIPVPKDTPQPPLTIDGHDGPSDFLGCFKLDSNTENDLSVGSSDRRRELLVDEVLSADPLAMGDLTGTMTNKRCLHYCATVHLTEGITHRYWLGGTAAGNVCYCGRGSLSLVDEVNIGKCNQPCTEWGDHGKHEACGGGDIESTAYVSVYNISVPATIPQPPTEIDISGKTSYLLGCYLLASNIEDSQGGPLDEIDYGEDLWMKNEVCVRLCSARGFWLAGTSTSHDSDRLSECYCGEGELVDMTQVHLSFCNEACSGSSGACGGIGYVSVYDVPLSNNAPISPNSVQGPNGQSDLLGCFSLKGSRANKALSTGALWLEEMDNELCVDFCTIGQFTLAGTVNGKDCYCGSGVVDPDDEVHLGKCNVKCGGSSDACGGKRRSDSTPGYVSIYSIPWRDSSPDIQDAIEGTDGQSIGLLGCYPYAGNEATEYGGSTVGLAMLTHVMTNEMCMAVCHGQGATLSGTRNGQDCYCRKHVPKGAKDSTQCSVVCDGKSPFSCGGVDYVLFYGTGLPAAGAHLQPTVEGTSKLLGCYSLYENYQTLAGGLEPSTEDMTNEVCLGLCKARGDSWMFGTHKGTECYCGEGPPQGVPWEDECNIECEGSSSHYSCGGAGYVVLYDIPLSDTAPGLQLTIGGTSKLLGCFPLEDNYLLLPGLPFTKPGLMANEVCLDHCKERNTWMFGTINGKYCFCGEGPPEGVDKRERCTTKCEDSDYSCGGEDHLVLYDIPLPGTSPVPVPAPVPSPVSNLQLVVDGTSDLMGCYPYSDNYVILTDGPFTRYGKMTNEVCLGICKEHGRWLFGTADSKYCYCGEGLPRGNRDDTKCDTSCEYSMSRYMCGGEHYLTFYRIAVPVIEPPPPSPDDVEGADSVGCFGVSSNRWKFEEDVFSSSKMTNKKCGRHCKYHDLWVFATTDGKDCFCGENVPTGPSPPHKCDTECGGDLGMACGSDTHMSVFKWREDSPSPPVTPPGIPPVTPPTTMLWEDEVDGAYSKGCFEDDPSSPVLDKYYFYSRTLTAEECGVECWKMKYDVFGTKNGLGCFCGTTVPNPNWRVDTCHTPCKGDKTVACGGTNSINVYQWAPYSSEDSYEESPDYPEPSVSSDSSSSSDSSEEGPGLSVGTVDGARSKGCFRDSASDRVLVGHGFKSDNMSAQECGRVCKSKKFKVFGVEFARECFCGDTVPRGDGNADNCNKPCTGERWEVCGGHSRINIYEFWAGVDVSSSSSSSSSSSEDEEEPTSLKDDSVEGAVALGCYKDDKDNRVLDEHKFDDKTGMTAQRCGNECYKMGYKFFGTEFGRECFCGNDAPDPDWKAGQCNSECTGNKWVACGGRHRINVFKWINGYGDGGSGSSPDDNSRDGSLHQDMYDGATYIGCYEDSRDKRVLGKDDLDKESMTTEICGDYCKHRGYAFFGTEYSTECFCGNYFRGKKTSDSNCDSPCAGEESTVCGGHSRISVYECNEHYEEEEEEEVMKPEPENMLGCYKDTSSKRVLNLKTNYKLDDMTPEKCYWHCRTVFGAKYYGLEYGKECYCGNHNSTYDDHPLDEGSCKMPCPGNKNKYCGGRNAITIYGRHKNK